MWHAAYLLRSGRDRTDGRSRVCVHQGEIAHSALTGRDINVETLCALPSAIVSVRRCHAEVYSNNREITALLAVVVLFALPGFSTASI